MNCTICITEKVSHDNMVWLECCHSLCMECYDNLTQNACPFCRAEIKGRKSAIDLDKEINSKNTDFYNNNHYNTSVNSYIIRQRNTEKHKKKRNRKKGFTSNKNRGPYQRKKKKFKNARNQRYQVFA